MYDIQCDLSTAARHLRDQGEEPAHDRPTRTRHCGCVLICLSYKGLGWGSGCCDTTGDVSSGGIAFSYTIN